MGEIRDWIWLTTVQGLSLRSQMRLLQYFDSPEAVFLADKTSLEQVEGLSKQERQALERKDLRRADQVLEDCRKERIGILTIQDAAYPKRLRSIDMPPLVLYYRGRLPAFDALPAIAVVGAREASGYGLSAAKRLGFQLGACGGAVISGAARGIDSLALEGALGAGGPVAAVLGNGLDIVYPSSARRLYADIEEHGCLLSEYIPGTKPLSGNFPRRNRVMSGLSLAVLVVEAAKHSGSLITAEFALEQGRDVFAVPGNIGLACCEGSNQLIQDGAGLVTCGWDILQNYQPRFPDRLHRAQRTGEKLTLAPSDLRQTQKPETESRQSKPSGPLPAAAESEKRIDNVPGTNYSDLIPLPDTLSADERALAEILQAGQKHVDDIIAESGMPPARVLSSLTLLEVKGYVTQQPGKRFELNLS